MWLKIKLILDKIKWITKNLTLKRDKYANNKTVSIDKMSI